MSEKSTFEAMLTGGHPNSLGNTVEVVEMIFEDKALLPDLYDCYSSEDEVVRLRTSNAFKRVWRENPEWVVPYIDRFLNEVSAIGQDSADWTTATLIRELGSFLSAEQATRATALLKRYLATANDWIVLNETMKSLEPLAKKDADLRTWMTPHVERLSQDSRKSVSKKATKLLALINK